MFRFENNRGKTIAELGQSSMCLVFKGNYSDGQKAVGSLIGFYNDF